MRKRLNCVNLADPDPARWRRFYKKHLDELKKEEELLPPEERTEKLPPQKDTVD